MLLLVIGNLLFYLPQRTESMCGLYGILGSQLSPFKTEAAQKLTPALVIVKPVQYWLEYGVLLDLSSPLLNTPFIFTYDRGDEQNQTVIDAYPDRRVICYTPGLPFIFYPADLPFDGKPLVGAEQVHRLLCNWRETLKHR